MHAHKMRSNLGQERANSVEAAVHERVFQPVGGAFGPAPFVTKGFGLAKVAALVPRMSAFVQGVKKPAQMVGEKRRKVGRLGVGKVGFAGEAFERARGSTLVALASLGGRVAGLNDAGHRVTGSGQGVAGGTGHGEEVPTQIGKDV